MNDEFQLSKTKAEPESEQVWKYIRFQIWKIVRMWQQIRIQTLVTSLHWVLWHCWLGDRKRLQHVKSLLQLSPKVLFQET